MGNKDESLYQAPPPLLLENVNDNPPPLPQYAPQSIGSNTNSKFLFFFVWMKMSVNTHTPHAEKPSSDRRPVTEGGMFPDGRLPVDINKSTNKGQKV